MTNLNELVGDPQNATLFNYLARVLLRWNHSFLKDVPLSSQSLEALEFLWPYVRAICSRNQVSEAILCIEPELDAGFTLKMTFEYPKRTDNLSVVVMIHCDNWVPTSIIAIECTPRFLWTDLSQLSLVGRP